MCILQSIEAIFKLKSRESQAQHTAEQIVHPTTEVYKQILRVMRGEDSFKRFEQRHIAFKIKFKSLNLRSKKQIKITFNVKIPKTSTITLTEAQRKKI